MKSMSRSDVSGLELIMFSFRNNIKTEEDVLLLIVHHSLLNNGFKCCESTNSSFLDDSGLSEILPEGWNSAEEFHIKYKCEETSFILTSTRTSDVINFNLMAPSLEKVSNVILKKKSVRCIVGSISTMIPECQRLLDRISKKLIAPFFSGSDECQIGLLNEVNEEKRKRNDVGVELEQSTNTKILNNDEMKSVKEKPKKNDVKVRNKQSSSKRITKNKETNSNNEKRQRDTRAKVTTTLNCSMQPKNNKIKLLKRKLNRFESQKKEEVIINAAQLASIHHQINGATSSKMKRAVKNKIREFESSCGLDLNNFEKGILDPLIDSKNRHVHPYDNFNKKKKY